MRWGDYSAMVSLTINVVSLTLYFAQGFWKNGMYFVGAALINFSLILLKDK